MVKLPKDIVRKQSIFTPRKGDKMIQEIEEIKEVVGENDEHSEGNSITEDGNEANSEAKRENDS